MFHEPSLLQESDLFTTIADKGTWCASSSFVDPNLSADSLYSGRCGGRSWIRSKLPDECSLDFSLLPFPVLPPDREDRNLDHPDRVDESSFSGKRYFSAGLTATTQAQMTVTLVSMMLQ